MINVTERARGFSRTATGLGTSAVRIGQSKPDTTVPRPPEGTPPGLYSPEPVRVDEPLGAEVNERLVSWAQDLEIFTEHLDRLQKANFGRLSMLTHPDTEDPDQLMLAARCLVAEWAVDDVYCDEEETGSVPELAGYRLALAVAAVDRPQLLDRYAGELRDGVRADPVLVALRSSMEFVTGAATPAQAGRLRHELANLFVGMAGEAAWRVSGHVPPVWEYLSARQLNSFIPCLALIDVVGGYVLAPDLYSDPRVRRATALAGSASTIANDIYSVAKDGTVAAGDYGLPSLIAAEENISMAQAMERSIAYHNDVVHAFEAAQRDLMAVPSPELNRFLWGLRAWIGGSNEWHRSNGRYQAVNGAGSTSR
jgi:2-methylisoborneol synthase